MFKLSTDLRTGVIEVVISGFWNEGEVEHFRAALAKEVSAVRATGRVQSTLYDYTDAVIQSQETVAQLAAMARANPMRSRKTAIYTAGRLARRQASRIADEGDRLRLFEDRGAAMEWLCA